MSSLHEAAPQAGGRCRSYLDATLGCRIDNGNHLLVVGQSRRHGLSEPHRRRRHADGPDQAAYAFLDRGGERWTLRPNAGRLPWWLFQPSRRVAGTHALDYLSGGFRLAAARPATSSPTGSTRRSLMFRRLWQPLAVAALNTEAEQGSAMVLARLLRESFGAGGAACRPLVPAVGLSESLVDPALARLRAIGVELRLGSRLKAIEFAGTRAARSPSTAAVSRWPRTRPSSSPSPRRLRRGWCRISSCPTSSAPSSMRITGSRRRPSGPLFIGPYRRHRGMGVPASRSVLSVTISAADRLVDTPAEALAARALAEVRRAYGLAAAALPPWQIVKEKRATFAATPAQQRRRPEATTRWTNLMLAGDFTATGLPATIEGAIRSGEAAAARTADAGSPTVELNFGRSFVV